MQIKRLRQYVRVKRYDGEIIKCEKAFFNYNVSIIDKIEAKEYIQIIHADYKNQKNIMPLVNPKITKYIGVSKQVCKSFEDLTGQDIELIYNPLELDKPKKLLKLISATRLTIEKGKDRMIKLGNLLNEAGVPYVWLIFTNDTNVINNPNIIYMKPRLDITNYMQEADFLVQLSDCEAYCYSVVESLILGKPVIVTDLPVYKELGLDNSNSIRLDLDFDDISIDKLTKEYKFEYIPKQDNWEGILSNTKSTYEKEKKSMFLVEATSKYEGTNTDDSELSKKYNKRYVPKKGEQWIVSFSRKEILEDKGFVNTIKQVKEEEK